MNPPTQLLDAFLLGLANTPVCLATCLPVLLPFLATSATENVRPGAGAIGSFLTGRLLGYLAFGLLVGTLGSFIPLQSARVGMDLVTLLLSVYLVVFALGLSATREHPRCLGVAAAGRNRSPWLVGLLTGMSLCPPFLLAATAALRMQSPLAGMLYFLLFFAGTSVLFLPAALVPRLTSKLGADGVRRAMTILALAVAFSFALRATADLGDAVGTTQSPAANTDAQRIAARTELPTPSPANLQAVLPAAEVFTPHTQPSPYVSGLGQTGRLAGYAFVCQNFMSAAEAEESEGYGGAVPVLLGIDPNGRITGLLLLEHSETPENVELVDDPEVLFRYHGQAIGAAFRVGGNVDVVSGATITNEAVALTVQYGGQGFSQKVLAQEIAAATAARQFPLPRKSILFLCLLLPAILLARWTRRHPAREVLSHLLSILLFGLVLATFVSAGDFFRLALHDWPSGRDGTAWAVRFGAVLLLTVIWGRLFCRAICPFGALTELLWRCSPIHLRVLPNTERVLRHLPAVLFWGMGLLSACLALPLVDRVEPFGLLSLALQNPGRIGTLREGRPLFLAIFVLTLTGGLFFRRFWCVYLCPAGAAFRVLARLRLARPIATGSCAHCPEKREAELLCPNCTQRLGTANAPTGTPSRAASVAASVVVAAVLACGVLLVAEKASPAQTEPEQTTPASTSPTAATTPPPTGPLTYPLNREEATVAGLSLHDALYWEAQAGGILQCQLCPRMCLLRDGERGRCKARVNLGGKLYSLVYGRAVARHIDPIEKKPLYHFLPGTGILSIATAGCNLGCRFCQNWSISQAFPEKARHLVLQPSDLIALAQEKRIPAIAYTYTEPSIYYEYMLDTAQLAHKAGLRNVMVTCGYINETPLRELAQVMDGANVDLKGFSEDFYREYCDGKLQPVLAALKVLHTEGVHLEITNLVIPGANDNPDMIRQMCEWIRDELSAEIPLHFSRYHPDYKMERPGPTPASTLQKAATIARTVGLQHVYVGNLRVAGGSDTVCPQCHKRLIERTGFFLRKNAVTKGKCTFCKHPIYGVWAGEEVGAAPAP